MSTPREWGAYFGDPWPSGICDEGTSVPVPVGEQCAWCDEPIEPMQQGSFMGKPGTAPGAVYQLAPIHRECSLRSAMGGIGHIEDHERWCKQEHDPDGGRTRRQSALEVWARVTRRDVPA